MGIRRLDHIGIIVEDPDAATAFFAALGLNADSSTSVDGDWADRVNGLRGTHADLVGIPFPDGHGWLELTRFVEPADASEGEAAASNRRGLRHVAFVVDDVDACVAAVQELGYDLVNEIVDYAGIYRLCYVRGPEGIIVELAEELGQSEG
jgi:catechol 2,3-dioxygenase-like lactoylglutathione lyase family enzyme